MARRVLIAGCGYVGSRAAELLVASGERVWGLTRTQRELPVGVVPIVADLAEGDLSGVPRDIDAVVYGVAAKQRDPDAYRRAYVTGLTRLLDATDPIDVLFVSSTSVYGVTDGGWVDESTATEPSGFPGQILLEAERLVLERGGDVLRLAGIYGPGRTRLIRLVEDGTAAIPSNPRYTNRIHRDDCAAAVVHLLTLRSAEQVYIGVDDDPADIAEVYRWIAEQLGVTLAHTAETSARGANKRCSNRRLRDSGFDLSYPTFREGYRELLRVWR